MNQFRITRFAAMTVSLAAMLVLAGGCESTEKTTDATDNGNAPLVKPESDGWATMAYPTGDRKTSALLLGKQAPAAVTIGREFTYRIKVTNLTNQKLTDVVVTDDLPAGFDLVSANPNYKTKTKDSISWAMDVLGPHESKTIEITGKAKSAEALHACASVTYAAHVCTRIAVVEPKLQLAKTATDKAIVCDGATLKYVVTNTGSGTAGNVVIEDKLPDGWKTADGKGDVKVAVGDLSAGESKTYTVQVTAEKTGKASSKATATADGGLKSEASTTTVLVKPKLVVTKKAPQKEFLGRKFLHEYTIENAGDGDARSTKVVNTVVGGKIVGVSRGGSVNGNTVSWDLGTIKPKESRKVAVEVTDNKSGDISSTVNATAYCADSSEATATTAVAGIPALLLEVVDQDDPIEVGDQVTYVITVTNQGSAPGTGIKIEANLENEMTLVSAGGATNGKAQGNKITFEPLGSLAPKEKATWRLVVKANKPADVRFQVNMNANEIGRPVSETESTTFFK